VENNRLSTLIACKLCFDRRPIAYGEGKHCAIGKGQGELWTKVRVFVNGSFPDNLSNQSFAFKHRGSFPTQCCQAMWRCMYCERKQFALAKFGKMRLDLRSIPHNESPSAIPFPGFEAGLGPIFGEMVCVSLKLTAEALLTSWLRFFARDAALLV
jgi:hypothetical protein